MQNPSEQDVERKNTIFYGLQELYPEGAPIAEGASVWNFEQLTEAWQGGEKPPTEQEIEIAAAITVEKRNAKRKTLRIRDQLRAWWQSEAVPDHIAGPFADKMESVLKLVDEGRISAAIEAVEYIEAPLKYGGRKRAELDDVCDHITKELKALIA